jgi:hypothetical protein
MAFTSSVGPRPEAGGTWGKGLVGPSEIGPPHFDSVSNLIPYLSEATSEETRESEAQEERRTTGPSTSCHAVGIDADDSGVAFSQAKRSLELRMSYGIRASANDKREWYNLPNDYR